MGRRHVAARRDPPPVASACRFAVVLSAVSAILCANAGAAEDDAAARAPDSLVLDPIVVTATRLRTPLLDVPASISVVEKRDVQDAQPTVGLDEALERVPGVFVQSSGNFAQDLRLQIRGFGTRAAFGIREIKVLVDGLPETLPDGQTQLDSLDLGAVERIEVLRGPAASLYGNASGGVVHIVTAEGPDEPVIATRVTGGSFGLQKYQVQTGGRAGKVRTFFHGSFMRQDGFRDHSATDNAIVSAKIRYELGDATDFTMLMNGVESPRADDPGGLTRAEVNADRRAARDLNRELDAGEDLRQGRVGWLARHAGELGELSGYAYVLYRDFEGRLPIRAEMGDGITAFHRVSPGGGLRYALQKPVAGVPQALTIGVDAQHQDDERRRFANLGGERGPLGLEQRERVTSIGPYVREALTPIDDLELSAGVRYDVVDFDADVDVPAASPEAGARSFDALSPAGGIRYRVRPWLAFFANVGTAFQVPTTTELASPEGAGFNRRLEPQTAISYELGGRALRDEPIAIGRLDAVRLSAGLALFYLDVRDELVEFESESGRTFFRNAGRSERYGLEADWRVEPLAGLTWSSAVTLLHARFRDYVAPAGRFDGNEEPGIPSWTVYSEIAYRHRSGAYGALEALLVDDYFVDDANTTRSHGYEVLSLRGGWERTFGRWTIGPFVGLNNVTDAAYDGTVRLNALGGRFFEPAPGFNVYGGVAISAGL